MGAFKSLIHPISFSEDTVTIRSGLFTTKILIQDIKAFTYYLSSGLHQGEVNLIALDVVFKAKFLPCDNDLIKNVATFLSQKGKTVAVINDTERVAVKNVTPKPDDKDAQKMVKALIRSSGRVDPKAISEIVKFLESNCLQFPYPSSYIEYMYSKYSYPFDPRTLLATYVLHEKQIFSGEDRKQLQKAKSIGIKYVKIRASEDQRMCPECKKHANKQYAIDDAPALPLCWECRCYYEPVL